MDWSNSNAYRVTGGDYLHINFLLIDTAREEQIGLGPEYPFGALGPGECIVSSNFQIDYALGESMILDIDINSLTKTQVKEYNTRIKPAGAPRADFQNFDTNTACQIVDFISEPFGKYPASS